MSSHDFQSLHLRRHLQDRNEEEGYLTVLKKDDSYVSFNVTRNYNLRPKELENENLYDYTETYYITGQIPNNANSNPNCMFLHPDDPFQDKKGVKKRKVAVIPDIIGPRPPHLFDIEEEELEKYSEIALLLCKPHRNSAQLLRSKRKYSEAF